MASLKTLHSFTVTIDKEVEDTSTMTLPDGKVVTTSQKVVKPIQVTIALKEPSRKEKQDLALFNTISYSKAINLGLITKIMMIQKLNANGGSPISSDEDRNLAAIHGKLQEMANEYVKLSSKSAGLETDEDKEKKDKLWAEYASLHKKAVDISTAYQSVFAHTAEQYTQNRVLTWLTLYLSYIKVGPDKWEPMFSGADFDAKETRLGEIEDAADAIYLASVGKLSERWMWYLFGHAATADEFARIEERQTKQAELEAKLKAEQDAKAIASVMETPVVVEAAPAAPTPEVAPVIG